MSQAIASAVFDSREEAEQAMIALRSAGIPQDAISVIGRSDDGSVGENGEEGEGSSGGFDSGDAAKGALGGAAAGSLLGLAALAIPGVGPLAAAGAVAAGAIPQGAAIGAAIGATAGTLSGMLADNGVNDEDAVYYEGRINEGAIFLAVHGDRPDVSIETARDVLYRNGGHSATRPRNAAGAQRP